MLTLVVQQRSTLKQVGFGQSVRFRLIEAIHVCIASKMLLLWLWLWLWRHLSIDERVE